MADSIILGTAPVQLRIEGLRRTLRDLHRAGVAAEDIKDSMHRLGSMVVESAQPRVPVASGRTRATLRAGRGKTKAVVRMGGAKVPYAPVIHYGWPARGIRAQPSLVEAFQAMQPRLVVALSDELAGLLAKHDLKPD